MSGQDAALLADLIRRATDPVMMTLTNDHVGWDRFGHDAMRYFQSLAAPPSAPSLDIRKVEAERGRAWDAVCDALDKVRPGWSAGKDCAMDCAVQTIFSLATPDAAPVAEIFPGTVADLDGLTVTNKERTK